jgi:hypothetical protein
MRNSVCAGSFMRSWRNGRGELGVGGVPFVAPGLPARGASTYGDSCWSGVSHSVSAGVFEETIGMLYWTALRT